MEEQAKTSPAELRDRMLSAGRRKTKAFKFGDAEVTLRQLSALESSGYIEDLQGEDNGKRLQAVARMIVASVFDADGVVAIFSESDIPVILGEMGPDGFGEIAGEVLELNSQTKAAREAALKNSKAPVSDLLSD